MTSRSSSLLPDPRLNNQIAHYDRDEVVADLLSFYNFLPHVSASDIAEAPPGGWPEITASSLAVHGIHKTPEVIELMRHLPYISYREPWILITAMVCDYRRVTTAHSERPYWLMLDVNESEWPAWVIQLTAGTDREGHRFILDTTDGTITMSCVCGPFQYPPTYKPEDPRSWRDRMCQPETVTLKDWLETCRREYLQMKVVPVPNDPNPNPECYGAPELLFHVGPLKPGTSDFREIEGLRKIYREYGWPDTEKYQKEACIQAIIPWWIKMVELWHKERKIEMEALWKSRGLSLVSSTDDAGKESYRWVKIQKGPTEMDEAS